ncbi:MAG: DUF1648 domain-containing protein [Bacteroidales bacterium]|nr:DUF1648 domain-containing protein [Bacteroidales bacterium]
MEERPKYQPNLTFIDLLGRNFSLLLLLLLWISAISLFRQLPVVIPGHFNLSGEVDGYASKYTFFLIPVLGSVLFVVLAILLRYPEKFNYPVKITEANAQRQYQLAVRLLHWLKATLLIVFNGLIWLRYFSAIESETLPALVLVIFLVLLTFIPLVIYFVASYRRK